MEEEEEEELSSGRQRSLLRKFAATPGHLAGQGYQRTLPGSWTRPGISRILMRMILFDLS